jgi:Ras family protein
LQDEYANFSQAASVGVHGYVLVYSIGSRTSFEKLKLINEKLVNMLGSKPPRVLVGSMSDLDKARQVAVSWTTSGEVKTFVCLC